jgi:hypothetical protein
VSRARTSILYLGVAVATAALFAVLIVFRADAALVAALSAAGTVAAAGFAAVASLGSMRAAAESSATARRARQSLAQSMRPRVRPSVERVGGTVRGTVRCAGARIAVDVTVTWILADGDTVVERIARLVPDQAEGLSDSGEALTADLALPDTADLRTAISMVWIEYGDDGRVGQWQDTWEVAVSPTDPVSFSPVASRLVD